MRTFISSFLSSDEVILLATRSACIFPSLSLVVVVVVLLTNDWGQSQTVGLRSPPPSDATTNRNCHPDRNK